MASATGAWNCSDPDDDRQATKPPRPSKQAAHCRTLATETGKPTVARETPTTELIFVTAGRSTVN